MQEIDPAQSIHHSARSKTVSYLIADPNTITIYRHDLESINIDMSNLDSIRDYFKLHTIEIKSDYQEHSKRHQKMQDKTKLYQEAVVSFGREQFENCKQSEILKSIDNFSNNFEQTHGCKVLMTSLHLDEGHKSESGKILHNYHAHVLIENYSFITHKTCLQKLDYRKLQTNLAKEFEHLGFARGKDYTTLQHEENQRAKEEYRKPKKIKPERLEHREYRQMKESEAGVELETIQPKEPISNSTVPINEQLQAENLAKSLQIAQLQEQLRLAKEQYDAERIKLKESGEAKQDDYKKLKAEYEQVKTKITFFENERLTKSFESFKPTFTREEVDYTQQIEDTYKSLTLFSGNKHEIITENPDTWKKTTQILTTKEVKQQYERLTQAKILAVNKLETGSNELAKTLEKTTEQLASSTETAERLKDAEQKYWQVRVENDVLNRENRTLKSIEGKEPQELQAKIVSQSEQIRTLSSEKFGLEYTNKNQEKQIDGLKTENTALKTAIERFLQLPIVNPLIQASKSLIECFIDGLEGIKSTFDNLQSKNKQLDEALATEKSLFEKLEIENSQLECKIDYLEEHGIKPKHEREQGHSFEM
jgi:hypothetical protein